MKITARYRQKQKVLDDYMPTKNGDEREEGEKEENEEREREGKRKRDREREREKERERKKERKRERERGERPVLQTKIETETVMQRVDR